MRHSLHVTRIAQIATCMALAITASALTLGGALCAVVS